MFFILVFHLHAKFDKALYTDTIRVRFVNSRRFVPNSLSYIICVPKKVLAKLLQKQKGAVFGSQCIYSQYMKPATSN